VDSPPFGQIAEQITPHQSLRPYPPHGDSLCQQ
jgi:hypothetical protein